MNENDPSDGEFWGATGGLSARGESEAGKPTDTAPVRLEVTAPATGAHKPARWDGQHVVAACGAVGFGAPVWVVWRPGSGPNGTAGEDEATRAVAEGLAVLLRAMGYGAVGGGGGRRMMAALSRAPLDS